MYVTWNLEGLEEMMSRLEAMEKNGKKAMNKAIEEGAKVLEEEMKLNIQANGLILSGALLDSIEYTIKRGGKSYKARVGLLGNARYGIFHEFGTAKMPARPWLEPAVIEKGDEARQVMIDYLKREILA